MQAADFVGSVKAYTEAIKRLPTDPRAYTNRAAAYTKLVALPEALKDAEEAIKVDKTYGKSSTLQTPSRPFGSSAPPPSYAGTRCSDN